VIFIGARSTIQAYATTTHGLAQAAVRAAEVRANLIALDPETMQYPVFLQYLGKGLFSAVNLNTNAVTLLDSRSDPDRQMISAAGAVQLSGKIAREARLSSDPAGVSSMIPLVIEVETEDLKLGSGR
jgi:hypothetical protein